MTDSQKQKMQFLSRASAVQKKLLTLQEIWQKETFLFQKFPFLETQCRQQILSLLSVREFVLWKISSIPDIVLQTILIRRYFLHDTMEKIAEYLHYDLRTIQRKHLQALDAFPFCISETTIFP